MAEISDSDFRFVNRKFMDDFCDGLVCNINEALMTKSVKLLKEMPRLLPQLAYLSLPRGPTPGLYSESVKWMLVAIDRIFSIVPEIPWDPSMVQVVDYPEVSSISGEESTDETYKGLKALFASERSSGSVQSQSVGFSGTEIQLSELVGPSALTQGVIPLQLADSGVGVREYLQMSSGSRSKPEASKVPGQVSCQVPETSSKSPGLVSSQAPTPSSNVPGQVSCQVHSLPRSKVPGQVSCQVPATSSSGRVPSSNVPGQVSCQVHSLPRSKVPGQVSCQVPATSSSGRVPSSNVPGLVSSQVHTLPPSKVPGLVSSQVPATPPSSQTTSPNVPGLVPSQVHVPPSSLNAPGLVSSQVHLPSSMVPGQVSCQVPPPTSASIGQTFCHANRQQSGATRVTWPFEQRHSFGNERTQESSEETDSTVRSKASARTLEWRRRQKKKKASREKSTAKEPLSSTPVSGQRQEVGSPEVSPIAYHSTSVAEISVLEVMDKLCDKMTERTELSERRAQEQMLRMGSFDRFDGSNEHEFGVWFLSLRNRLDRANVDDGVKLEHLIGCLQGSARREFFELVDRPTWDEAVKVLLDRYSSEQRCSKRVIAFQSCRQRQNESAKEFAARLKASCPLGTDCPEVYRRGVLIGRLLDGLRNVDYKRIAARADQDSSMDFDRVVTEIVKEEEIDSMYPNGRQVQSKFDRGLNQRTGGENANQWCTFCAAYTNHTVQSCRQSRQGSYYARQPFHAASGVNSNSQQGRYRAPGPSKCYSCGMVGHVAARCTRMSNNFANQQVNYGASAVNNTPVLSHSVTPTNVSQSSYVPQVSYTGTRQQWSAPPPASNGVNQSIAHASQQDHRRYVRTVLHGTTDGPLPNEHAVPELQEVVSELRDQLAEWKGLAKSQPKASQSEFPESGKTIGVVRLPVGSVISSVVSSHSKGIAAIVHGVAVPANRFTADTGAVANLIDEEFIKRLQQPPEVKPCMVPLMDVNQNGIKCEGVCIVTVTLGSETHEVSCHVKRDLGEDMLLGLPGCKLWRLRLVNESGLDLTPVGAAGSVVARVKKVLPLQDSDSEAFFVFSDQKGNPKVGALVPLDSSDLQDDDLECELRDSGEVMSAISSSLNLKVGDSFGPDEKNLMLNLLQELHGAFSKASEASTVQDISDIGCVNTYHRIDTGTAAPFRMRERRLPLNQREEVRKMVKDLLDQGVIVNSNSDYASCIVLVKKSNGAWRFCIDFRRLNQDTKRDSFPMPRVDDLVDTMSGAVVFSSLDLKAGYYQVPMHPDDAHKTAFTALGRLYHFVRLPFGLVTAPATFSRVMSNILSEFIGICVGVYLDDVIIFSKSVSDHLIHVRQVIETLMQEGVKLNQKKCSFLLDEIKYLGHVISGRGISADPAKTKAIREFTRPSTKKQLQRFIGMVGFIRRYFRNLSVRLHVLHKLLVGLDKPSSVVPWNEEAVNQFEALKVELSNPPILAMPLVNQPYVVTSDACQEGFGGILQQNQVGTLKTIAYASRRTSSAESRYSASELELRALVYALQTFRPYVLGVAVECLTDHRPLIALLKCNEPSAKLFRWSLLLQEYDIVIRYSPGKSNFVADALSREASIRAVRVTAADRECVLQWHHCSAPSAAHSGVQVMFNRLRPFYLAKWPTLLNDVKEFVSKCDVCKSRSIRYERLPFVSKPPPAQPRQVWFMDFTEIRRTVRVKYCLVIVDAFSRYLLAFAASSQDGQRTIKSLETLVARFGCPVELCSDAGTHFTSRLVQEYLEKQGIVHSVGTPYSKSTNGLVERVNRTLQTILAKKLKEENVNLNCWETRLEVAVGAYNASPHKSLGMRSPFEVMFGSKYASQNTEYESEPVMLKFWERVREDILKSQAQYTAGRFVDSNTTKFQVGDTVWIRDMTKLSQRTAKIELPNSLSGRILEIGRRSALIRLCDGGSIRRPLSFLQLRTESL